MLCSKATLLTLALALLASSSPTPAERGLDIPLSKRGSLTTSDGIFDGAKAAVARLELEKYVSLLLLSI